MTLKYVSRSMRDQNPVMEMIRINGGITEKEVRSFYPKFKAIHLRHRLGKALTVKKCSKGHKHLWLYRTNRPDGDKHNRSIFLKYFKGVRPEPRSTVVRSFKCIAIVKKLKVEMIPNKKGKYPRHLRSEKIVKERCNETVLTQDEKVFSERRCYAHRRG